MNGGLVKNITRTEDKKKCVVNRGLVKKRDRVVRKKCYGAARVRKTELSEKT